MEKLVNIAFQGGTHGNFLRFFIDKFSWHTKDINELPFTENNTSHLPVNYSGLISRYHPADQEPYFQNVDEPHILITVEKEDLLFIERWVTTRAGDFKVDTSQESIQVNSAFLHEFNWGKKFAKLYNVDLEKTPRIPKWLLRDFYKLSFLDPNHSGFIANDNVYRKNQPKNTFLFPVSSFWESERFFDTLEKLDKKFDLRLDMNGQSVYNLFQKKLQFLDTRFRAQKVIDSIKNNEHMDVKDLDTVEQAYIYAWLEQSFEFIVAPMHNSFFKNTSEILEWIELYPLHYKAMNPNLPIFNGIPNPFYLHNLKK